VLYPFPAAPVTVAPLMGRVVLFSSAHMLHRVLPSKKKRLCFTTWFFAKSASSARTGRGSEAARAGTSSHWPASANSPPHSQSAARVSRAGAKGAANDSRKIDDWGAQVGTEGTEKGAEADTVANTSAADWQRRSELASAGQTEASSTPSSRSEIASTPVEQSDAAPVTADQSEAAAAAEEARALLRPDLRKHLMKVVFAEEWAASIAAAHPESEPRAALLSTHWHEVGIISRALAGRYPAGLGLVARVAAVGSAEEQAALGVTWF